MPTEEPVRRQGREADHLDRGAGLAGSVGVRGGVRGFPHRPLRLPPRRCRLSYVVVDIDVASAILKGQPSADLARRLADQQLATTFVTIDELTQWTYLHRWGPQRRAGLRAFFASVVVWPCTVQAAAMWSEIQAHARLRVRPDRSSTPGSASYIARDLPLATLNNKDNVDFAEHEASNSSMNTVGVE
jgi:predicted nucleic acid-binding protein